MRPVATLIGCACLCIAAVFPGNRPAAAAEAVVAPASARPLSSTVQGTWQVVQLPLNWRRKNLREPRPRELAVALVGPSPEDIAADNAPCGPPQSVMLIATSDTGRMRTRTLHKGEYCSSAWKAPAGLSWAHGPRVAVDSIAVAMAASGAIEITYTFKRDEGHTEDAVSNSAQRGVWKQVVTVEQIRSFVESP